MVNPQVSLETLPSGVEVGPLGHLSDGRAKVAETAQGDPKTVEPSDRGPPCRPPSRADQVLMGPSELLRHHALEAVRRLNARSPATLQGREPLGGPAETLARLRPQVPVSDRGFPGEPEPERAGFAPDLGGRALRQAGQRGQQDVRVPGLPGELREPVQAFLQAAEPGPLPFRQAPPEDPDIDARPAQLAMQLVDHPGGWSRGPRHEGQQAAKMERPDLGPAKEAPEGDGRATTRLPPPHLESGPPRRVGHASIPAQRKVSSRAPSSSRWTEERTSRWTSIGVRFAFTFTNP